MKPITDNLAGDTSGDIPETNTTPTTFALPVSDCGCFLTGLIDRDSFLMSDRPMPTYGVLVWYEDKETARAAAKAAIDAHWMPLPEPPEAK